MTGDISAVLVDPRQNYSSVRMQQGRVLTDVDWNESENLISERLRGLLNDLVCGYGSTNDGFRLVDAATASVNVPTGGDGTAPQATYDVQLAEGTFLLGGQLHHWPDNNAETLLTQHDWLQLSGRDADELPDAPASGRTDLVYLHTFEQPVRAIEDRELRERALGGPDTTTRLKAMRRVAVLSDAGDTCRDSAAALHADVTAPAPGDNSGKPHTLDADTCQLLSKARLTVDFVNAGEAQDPCKPSVTQGYLGAENQAIRVQLSAGNRFLWAYDNGEPFYRVQVSDSTPSGDGSIEITFLNPPRDPVLFPLQGAVVEILPWGSRLANLEKAAETHGQLARVTESYNPGDDTLRIAPAVPAEMLDWLNSTDRNAIFSPRDPDDEQRYFYARIWQPGPEESSDLDHVFTPDTPVTLPGTGLQLNFFDFGLPGDYWVVAARPNTPDLVVPWRLLDAAAPFGPERFYVPLGLVHWETGIDGEPVARVEDCRHRFRKLCQVESCCTVHVGDGRQSHGEVNDLQAAIDLLPPEEGGQICILPGEHEAAAAVVNRQNIVIQGCGPRSRVVAAPSQTAPLLQIAGSTQITVRDLAMESAEGRLISAERSDGLTLSALHLTAHDRGAIHTSSVDDLVLRDCRILAALLSSPRIGIARGLEPAVFLSGLRLRVYRNRIQASVGHRRLSALGGLQIGGDSRDVLIAWNLVEGGNGNGITLGSIDFQRRSVLSSRNLLRAYYAGSRAQARFSSWLVLTDDDCVNLDPRPFPPGDPDDPDPRRPMSEGPVEDCRIIRNRIVGMGASGISVAYWFDPDDEHDAILTDRLRIEENEIRACMQVDVAAIPSRLREIVAFGGITLAVGDQITIRDNVIMDTGTGHASPIVGIYLQDGVAVVVERNHLRDNGRIATLESTIPLGRTGGILLGMVRPGIDLLVPFGKQQHVRQDGAPAAIVDSNVVTAREGRALTIVGVGPMVIHGNQLTAHGSNSLRRIAVAGRQTNQLATSRLASVELNARNQTTNPLMAFLDVLGGNAVAVLNLGLSNEIYLQLLGFSGLGLIDAPQSDDQRFHDDIALLANGNVQFNDNQVVFDSLSQAVTLSMSSILLLSLDDISMQDNQCDCDLLFDFVAVHALTFGWSVRVQGNRFKEGLLNAFLSSVSLGIYNDTTHNQGTHCFLHAGLLEPRINLSGGPTGMSAELDSNRHLAPTSLCLPFNNRKNDFRSAAGLQRQ